MIDNGSRVSDSLLSRRIRQMMALDPSATAMFFDGLAFPWSFYSDAVTDLQSLLAGHPAARGREWPSQPARSAGGADRHHRHRARGGDAEPAPR